MYQSGEWIILAEIAHNRTSLDIGEIVENIV